MRGDAGCGEMGGDGWKWVEMGGGMGRLVEMGGDVGKYGDIWGDMGRCGEMCGDVWRYGEMSHLHAHVFHEVIHRLLLLLRRYHLRHAHKGW